MLYFPVSAPQLPPIEDVDTVFGWTLERYHEAINAGVFTENDRIELLFGQIIPKTSVGVAHRECLKLVRRYFRKLDDTYDSGVQDPITLPDHSEPEPDFSVITRKTYTLATGHPHPEDVHLVVEVAD